MICDFLIIGGGSAGCVIARRLADRTRDRIILLEAGKSDEGDPAAIDLAQLDKQTTDYDWGFQSSPLDGSARVMDYSRARILGGCGNHNDCAYLEPPASDFLGWEALGAKGWGPGDVQPFFARIREFVHVDREYERSSVSQAFVSAGKELGFPETPFHKEILPGVGWFPLNSRGKLRHSSSVAYLHPLKRLPPHLEVRTETLAKKLLLDGTRVVGAETSRGRIFARREVVLTAGAIQTPQLLMLSGIGPQQHLRKHGIPVAVDLPGIGSHLLDHVCVSVCWELKEPVPQWVHTPYQATLLAKIDRDAPAPDLLFHFGLRPDDAQNPGASSHADPADCVVVQPNVARARSEGCVKLSSADPFDKPLIRLNYLSDKDGYDLRMLWEGLRLARRLGSTQRMGQLIKTETAPGRDIQSDDGLKAYIREACKTVFHACGTAAMGNSENPQTVVDPRLRVKGVTGLRVCDASVFPSLVTVNINCTVMMVAEKAADMILADRR
nr:GMC oxidoreductase [Ruegeria atlantica]